MIVSVPRSLFPLGRSLRTRFPQIKNPWGYLIYASVTYRRIMRWLLK
jgi:hypothetical protein